MLQSWLNLANMSYKMDVPKKRQNTYNLGRWNSFQADNDWASFGMEEKHVVDLAQFSKHVLQYSKINYFLSNVIHIR